MQAIRILFFAIGIFVIAATIGSAVRTVILPRGIPVRISRVVFLSVRIIFRLRTGRSATYEKQDRIMALYAPLSLLVLLMVWLTLVLGGFMAAFWGLGGRSLREAFILSGSSLLTLGFERAESLPATILAFFEAAIGLVLLAMLITYLPSLYGAFSRREAAVTALEVRAGSPPSGVEMIGRFFVMQRIDRLTDVWARWETWFVEVEETHTSFPSLVFFRSPQPEHSWITAAGAVLDGASLTASTVDIPRDAQAEFCIRAGYLALRQIAEFFRIPFDRDPAPTNPITITRNEFEDAYERMAQAGVPLKPDREECWRSFAGWRVNYDAVLVALAELTMAPLAPWSSDRALGTWRPPLFQRLASRSRKRRLVGA
ncbi:hypothetical protein BH20ACT24_BH20ACT24_12770 [soil metagenome]